MLRIKAVKEVLRNVFTRNMKENSVFHPSGYISFLVIFRHGKKSNSLHLWVIVVLPTLWFVGAAVLFYQNTIEIAQILYYLIIIKKSCTTAHLSWCGNAFVEIVFPF